MWCSCCCAEVKFVGAGGCSVNQLITAMHKVKWDGIVNWLAVPWVMWLQSCSFVL